MKVLSLFDGMSCGQLALQEAGINVSKYMASEIDKHSMKITEKNFPQTEQLGDVTKVKGKDLGEVDLLIGGSPCQGFSFAGKQLNFNDDRSKLFFEFARLLNQCEPKYFLLENVYMKKEYRNIISGILGVQPIRINSSSFSPVKRDRLYWTNIPFDKEKIPKDSGLSFDDINTKNQDWMSEEKVDKIRQWKSQQNPIKTAIKEGAKKKVPCLVARGYNQYHGGAVLIENNGKYRYLTNDEAEACHGLPKGYTEGVSDRERSRMIGNGWDIRVVTHIFKGLENK